MATDDGDALTNELADGLAEAHVQVRRAEARLEAAIGDRERALVRLLQLEAEVGDSTACDSPRARLEAQRAAHVRSVNEARMHASALAESMVRRWDLSRQLLTSERDNDV